jgi:hypothetical protein
MSVKTYAGSCHCKAVKFEADIDLSAGTGKCNCSICTKMRKWGTNIKPDAFRLLSGENDLSTYQFNTKSGTYYFCKHCGMHPFSKGYIEQIGGAFVSINLGSLDNASDAELASAPVSYSDGRNNNWMESPAETRYL